MDRLRARQEWQVFVALPRADRRLAAVWWAALIARGVLPALFAEFRNRHSVDRGDVPRLDDEPAVRAAVDRADATDVVDRLPAGVAPVLQGQRSKVLACIMIC